MPKLKLKYILFFVTLLTIVSPLLSKYARADAAKLDELTKKTKQIYSLVSAQDCTDGGGLKSDEVGADGGPFEYKSGFGVFMTTAGHILDDTDGMWECGNDFDPMFKAILKNGSDTEFYSGWNDYKSVPSGNLKYISNNDYLNFIDDDGNALYGSKPKEKLTAQIGRSRAQIEKGLTDDDKKAMRYIGLMAAFTIGCEAEPVDGNTGGDKVKIGDQYYKVGDDNGHVTVGGDSTYGFSDGEASCTTIGEQLTALHDSYQKSTGDTTDGSANVDTSGETVEPNCENTSGVTGWIICPIIDGAFGIMRVVEGAVVGQLKFTLDDIGKTEGSDATDAIKEGHNSMLVTANILFAIGIMWIVISQAITGGGGGGFFGAYEAKKMLPKLIAGIIVANLSWELVNLALKVTNAVGDSMKSIIMTPFPDAKNMEFSLNSGSDLLIVGIVGVGAVVMAIFGFFAVSPILIAIVIAILMAMIFAIMRKGMIIVLVTFAPIMLALSPFMPNLFKRYYKLLMNLILFYIVVMISVAGCAVIGFITFQGSGGDQATSIGDSLTKLLGIALYFGWMFPVLAFAKNNFDVVGKVGGSLQAAGNKWGRQVGQNRLQGNMHRQERELKKGWKLQRKKEKALDRSMSKIGKKNKNGEYTAGARFAQMRQSGFKPGDKTKAVTSGLAKNRVTSRIPGVKKLDESMDRRVQDRTAMMSEVGDQLIDQKVKQATKEASYKSFSAVSDPRSMAAVDGHPAVKINTLNDAYGHLAVGRKVKYIDGDGKEQEVDGNDIGVRYMAAAAIAGDGAQAYNLQKVIETGDPASEEVKYARASLSYMRDKGGDSLAKAAPDIMGIPQSVALGSGSTAETITASKDKSLFRDYTDYRGNKQVTGTAIDLLSNNDQSEIDQVFGEFKEMNDPASVKSRFKKNGHNQAMASAIDAHFEANPTETISFGGDKYDASNKNELKVAIGVSRAETETSTPGYPQQPNIPNDDDFSANNNQ